MDYYENADGWNSAALALYNLEHYQQAIYSICVAVELYLKSRLQLVPHEMNLETSHDTINIYNTLASIYGGNTAVEKAMPKIRKYFNESRYPSHPSVVFDKGLADNFKDIIHEVKQYIDIQCVATENDLLNKYKKCR